MNLLLLIYGIIIGFAVAAPVGPVALLCINRSLGYRFSSGLVAGLGAATADAICGCVALYGVAALSDILTDHLAVTNIVGGVILCGFGLVALARKTLESKHHETVFARVGTFATAFYLTMSNPMTLVCMAAVFAVFGLEDSFRNPLNVVPLFMGLFAGSSLWWILLCKGACHFKSVISNSVLIAINRTVGFIIIALGLLSVCTGIHRIVISGAP